MNQQSLIQRPHGDPAHLLPARANTQLVNTYRGSTIAAQNPNRPLNEHHNNCDHNYSRVQQSIDRALLNKVTNIEERNEGIENVLRAINHRQSGVYDKVAPLEKSLELQCATVSTILRKLTWLEEVLPHTGHIKQILDLQTAALEHTNRCIQNDTHLFHRLAKLETHVSKLLSDVQLVLFKQNCLGTAVDKASTEITALGKNSQIASTSFNKDMAALTNAIALLNGNLLDSNRQTSQLSARIEALERKEVNSSKEIRADLSSLIAEIHVWRCENIILKMTPGESKPMKKKRPESKISFEEGFEKKKKKFMTLAQQEHHLGEVDFVKPLARSFNSRTEQKLHETDITLEEESVCKPVQQKRRWEDELKTAMEKFRGNRVHGVEAPDLYHLSTSSAADAGPAVSDSVEDDAEELLSGSYVDVMEMLPTKEEIPLVEHGILQLQENDNVDTLVPTSLHPARFIFRKAVAIVFAIILSLVFATILSLVFFRFLIADNNFAILAKVAMVSIALAFIHFCFLTADREFNSSVVE